MYVLALAASVSYGSLGEHDLLQQIQGQGFQTHELQGHEFQSQELQGHEFESYEPQGHEFQGYELQGHESQSDDLRGHEFQHHEPATSYQSFTLESGPHHAFLTHDEHDISPKHY